MICASRAGVPRLFSWVAVVRRRWCRPITRRSLRSRCNEMSGPDSAGSLPSLIMVSRDLTCVLKDRYPKVPDRLNPIPSITARNWSPEVTFIKSCIADLFHNVDLPWLTQSTSPSVIEVLLVTSYVAEHRSAIAATN
jgi:hypothetical protein